MGISPVMNISHRSYLIMEFRELTFRAPARFLMSLLFILSGISKLTSVAQTQAYMEAYGVPGKLLWPAAALEISGGTLILIGQFTMPVAVILSGWCLLTASIFHMDLKDQTQLIMFLKNMAMAGGFLILAESARETVYRPKAAASDKV
jgi:putative oxidoreductase